MIRQAISCDICGAEKRQTNHWFVASEQGGELRLSGWSSRMRQRAVTKHLCGQTCLHKLVDEFMARTIAGRVATTTSEAAESRGMLKSTPDASLTSPSAYPEFESSARLLSSGGESFTRSVTKPSAIPPAPALPLQPRLVEAAPISAAMPPRSEEIPNYASRRWRAEAWERERNRELRSSERHSRHKGL